MNSQERRAGGSKNSVYSSLFRSMFSSRHLPTYPGFSAFTDDQRGTLLKYFDELGMTSTKRCNIELIGRCSEEVGTTVEKIKVIIIGDIQ